MKAPLKTAQDERTRAHRAVNWVVSIILLIFAIWSIHLNSETMRVYKTTVQSFTEMDSKIGQISNDIASVKDVCNKTTVVVPVAPIDGELNP